MGRMGIVKESFGPLSSKEMQNRKSHVGHIDSNKDP